jgi:glyoxylase-like metal-dependent hydrolase (beta-lactamase superfamily II)
MGRQHRTTRFFHVSNHYMPQTIAQSPRVTILTAPNPGPMTLEGTNTYVVGQDPAYVIDPGPDIPEYIDALAGWLQETHRRVAAIFLTHGHPDHAPGAARLSKILGGVPLWASETMSYETARAAAVDSRFGPHQRFAAGTDTLEVISTPGHSHDHVAFWLPSSRILFAGDTVLGRGSSVIAPPDGDMLLYMRTLDEMLALDPAMIAPGHGPVITDPGAKISEYITHRNEREQQILGVLRQGPAGLEDLVNKIYVDTDPRLLDYARRSVEAQLLKLQVEHRAHRIRGEYWQT